MYVFQINSFRKLVISSCVFMEQMYKKVIIIVKEKALTS